MDEAHKGYGIHAVILTSRGSSRLFSSADILQAVQTVMKFHRSSIRPCGAEAAIHQYGYSVMLHRNAKAVSATSPTGYVFGVPLNEMVVSDV